MEAGNRQPIAVPRLVPDQPFPAYSYVTGRYPHPTRDPAGHSFGLVETRLPAPDPNRWRDSRSYLYAIDLFNHGYYWEAHEAWEGLWHACGRRGATPDFLKGLIKFAAAGVKAREGRPEGIRRHGQRGAELFTQVAQQLPPGQESYFGLSLAQLIGLAGNLASGALPLQTPDEGPVEIVFPFTLRPEDSPAA